MLATIETFQRNDSAEANAARQRLADGLARPLLVHVHIPKCAGTSFNNLLRISFGAGHLDAYLPVPDAVFSNDEFVQRVAAAPQIQSIASHSIRRFPRILGDYVPLYVCFLRDPLEWYLSNLTYVLKNCAELSADHRSILPPDLGSLSVRDLAQWLMDRTEQEGRVRTYYDRMTLVEYLVTSTHDDCVLSNPSAPPTPAVRETSLLNLSQHLLNSFFFVGVVEKMPEGLAILRRKLNAYGLCLAPGEMPVLNTSHERRGDLSWLTEADPLGRRILSCLERDRRLYAHALACFDRERHRDEEQQLGTI